MKVIARIAFGLLAVIFLLGTACRKYPPPIQTNTDPPELCEPIQGFNPQSPEQYSFFPKTRYYYSLAKFNPENEREIFALRFDSAERSRNPSELICYNRQNGFFEVVWQKQRGVLPVIRNYCPGPQGKMLIESTTREIYIMPNHGGIPKKIVAKPANGSAALSNPNWNRDGSQFMVYVDRGIGIPGFSVIFNSDGKPLDTIGQQLPPNGSFSGTLNLYTAWDNNGTVYQYNTDFDKTVRSYHTPLKTATGQNIAFSPNGYEMIVCDIDYIYKINLIDSSRAPLRKICETKQYGMPAYSFYGNKIIFIKQCFEGLGKDSFLFSGSVHLMDAGCYHSDSLPLPVQ